MRIAYAPELVEETVLLAERTASPHDARAFRHERNGIYEQPAVEQREAGFRALHLRWFVRLGLHVPIEQVIDDSPAISARLVDARVLRALTRRDEGADLIDQVLPGAAPLLVIRLRPMTLLDREGLQPLLRHELTHVADMLDPSFGYERSLPGVDGGPSADNILRDRYRVLWDATIDGRLVKAGTLGERARDARLREFAATFAMLGDDLPNAFAAWFDQARPTHRALVEFAQAPRTSDNTPVAGTGRCPLCRFPVASLDERPERLSSHAQAMIRADHQNWRIEMGLCPQCLDLYEARYEETIAVARC
jgi:hypothetical protein